MNRLLLVSMLVVGFVGGFVGGSAATCFALRIEDNIDLQFANDEAVLGRWTSVDFVEYPNQFHSERRQFGGDLYLKELKFLPGGKIVDLLAGVGASDGVPGQRMW